MLLQKPWLTKSRLKIKTVKNLIFIGTIILLLPSFGYWYYVIDNPNPKFYERVPGGNEKFLHDWIYENTSRDELILNDHSNAAQWLIGQGPQSHINGWIQDKYIALGKFNRDTQSFVPKIPAAIAIIQANQILKNPWDYEYIKTTIKKLDIKYLYISERTDVKAKCKPSRMCYPVSEDWAWKTYSGNSRIGMYEHHPNLELVLRNGNSAIFKVI